jgi:hypothetical protein
MQERTKLALFVGLALLCEPIYPSASAQQPATSNQTQVEQSASEATLDAIKESVQGIWRALETQNAQTNAAREANNAEDDLKAQTSMASSAYFQVWISFGALVVGAVTLAFLFASLRQTRAALGVASKQLEDSRDAARRTEAAANRQFVAQHRPHMHLKQMHMAPLEPNKPVVLRYLAINQGHTSATEIRHCHAFIVTERKQAWGFPNYSGGKDVVGLSFKIEPGRREFRTEVGPAFSAEEIGKINAGEAFLIAFGYFTYADDNGTYWSRAFWRVLNPYSMQLEGVEDGEYEYTE